jgi:hypothetical protein
MTNLTPEDPSADPPNVLTDGRDAEDVVNDELPLDPAGPTELGDAIDG